MKAAADRQSNVTRRDAMKGGVGAASLAAIAPVVLHTVAATIRRRTSF